MIGRESYEDVEKNKDGYVDQCSYDVSDRCFICCPPVGLSGNNSNYRGRDNICKWYL